LSRKRILSVSLPVLLSAGTLMPLPMWADYHVLPLTELRDKARSASEDRARNIEDIERVLSYPAAAQALGKSNVNGDQMRRAVATLSDQELTRLANQARASEKDVQGGLIVGILALIGLIVVIIIVLSLVA
jgi:CHASE3 domain sensor protein